MLVFNSKNLCFFHCSEAINGIVHSVQDFIENVENWGIAKEKELSKSMNSWKVEVFNLFD